MHHPRTMLDKIWDSRAVTTRDDGTALLWIDRGWSASSPGGSRPRSLPAHARFCVIRSIAK